MARGAAGQPAGSCPRHLLFAAPAAAAAPPIPAGCGPTAAQQRTARPPRGWPRTCSRCVCSMTALLTSGWQCPTLTVTMPANACTRWVPTAAAAGAGACVIVMGRACARFKCRRRSRRHTGGSGRAPASTWQAPGKAPALPAVQRHRGGAPSHTPLHPAQHPAQHPAHIQVAPPCLVKQVLHLAVHNHHCLVQKGTGAGTRKPVSCGCLGRGAGAGSGMRRRLLGAAAAGSVMPAGLDATVPAQAHLGS